MPDLDKARKGPQGRAAYCQHQTRFCSFTRGLTPWLLYLLSISLKHYFLHLPSFSSPTGFLALSQSLCPIPNNISVFNTDTALPHFEVPNLIQCVRFHILNKMYKFLKWNSNSQIVTRDQVNKILQEIWHTYAPKGNTINFKAALTCYRKTSVESQL